MVENCDTCACFPVCDRKFNMFGVFMGWADCNNWIPEVKHGKWIVSKEDWVYSKDANIEIHIELEYECSRCGGKNEEKSNYCPNCAATMCEE